jgi:hypothetical protein
MVYALTMYGSVRYANVRAGIASEWEAPEARSRIRQRIINWLYVVRTMVGRTANRSFMV